VTVLGLLAHTFIGLVGLVLLPIMGARALLHARRCEWVQVSGDELRIGRRTVSRMRIRAIPLARIATVKLVPPPKRSHEALQITLLDGEVVWIGRGYSAPIAVLEALRDHLAELTGACP